MKHVPRLAEEPGSLIEYRSAHPEDTVAPKEESKDVWNRFRDSQAYQDIRDALASAQGGLCLYCEQRVVNDAGVLISNDNQIEHVKAKSGASDRTLNGQNLALCCGGGTYPHHSDTSRRYDKAGSVSCGQTKDDGELGDGCDPRVFPWSPRLVDIGLDGTLSANVSACEAVGVSPVALNDTIDKVLNLNCERLRVARQSVAAGIREEFNWLANELLLRTKLNANQVRAFEDLLVEGRLAPDERGYLRAFWTTERQYLEPWSDIWLTKNRHRLGCPPDEVRTEGTS